MKQMASQNSVQFSEVIKYKTRRQPYSPETSDYDSDYSIKFCEPQANLISNPQSKILYKMYFKL